MNEATKKRNQEQLHALGVRVNPNLPTIEVPSELSPRSPRDVCARAFVLTFVIGIGYGRTGSEMLGRIQQAGLADHLSPMEHELLAQPSYTQSDTANAAWLAEAVQACAWALGYLPLHPLQGASDELASHFRSDAQQRITSARLLPFDELYTQADLHYRLHWAARQARLDSTAFPIPEVAVEMRRRALDWIIGVPKEWDDLRVNRQNSITTALLSADLVIT